MVRILVQAFYASRSSSISLLYRRSAVDLKSNACRVLNPPSSARYALGNPGKLSYFMRRRLAATLSEINSVAHGLIRSEKTAC
eukprot:IDg9451t1